MKKYLSVISLFNFSVIKKIIFILSASLFLQLLLFFNSFEKTEISLSGVIDSSGIKYIFTISMIVLFFVIYKNYNDISKSYTAEKLMISGKNIFFMQILNSIMYFTILMASEMIFLYCMCKYYVANSVSADMNNQTIALATILNPVMHTFFPLKDIILEIRNILNFFAFGIITSVNPKGRNSMKALRLFTIFTMSGMFFQRNSIYKGFVNVSVFLMILLPLIIIESELKGEKYE